MYNHKLFKKIISAFLICFLVIPATDNCIFTTAVVQSANLEYTAESVYNAMISLKNKYPTGTKWTNDNFYAWNGGIYYGGYGCAGFAFMLSDSAFGTLPAEMIYTFEPNKFRIGDIVRYRGHSVIILEIKENSFIVAEGNFNSSVNWGREITFSEIKNNFENYMTRYPKETAPTYEQGDLNDDGNIDSTDASVVLAEYALLQTGYVSSLTETQKESADVNKDGLIDASDASKILAYYSVLSTGGKPKWD